MRNIAESERPAGKKPRQPTPQPPVGSRRGGPILTPQVQEGEDRAPESRSFLGGLNLLGSGN
jgi:hypothetical protein